MALIDDPETGEPSVKAVRQGFAMPGAIEPEATVNPNLAGDKKIAEKFEKQDLSRLLQLQRNRREMEDIWKAEENIYFGKHDEKKAYARQWGAELYLPLGAVQLETIVDHLEAAIFPPGETFSCRPIDAHNALHADNAKNMQAAQEHNLANRMHIRRFAAPMFRQFAMHGLSVLKTPWRSRSIPMRRIGLDEHGLATPQETVFEKRGNILQIVDLHNFYVYPETTVDLDRDTTTFEIFFRTKEEVIQQGKRGRWINVKEAMDSAKNADTQSARQAQISRFARLGVVDYGQALKDLHECLEVQGPAMLPGDDFPRLYIRTYIGTKAVRIQKMPYDHQMPTYSWLRCFEIPNFAYPISFTARFRMLQYQINATANQTMDLTTLALIPVIFYDPSTMFGHELDNLEWRPGAKWPIGGDNVKVAQPGLDPSMGYQTMQILRGLMSELGSTPPVMRGQLAGGRGERTLGGLEMLRSQATFPLENIAARLESATFEPMLDKLGLDLQQFLTGDEWLRVTGKPKVLVRQEDLLGDFAYKWLGTVKRKADSVQTGQLIQFVTQLKDLMGKPLPHMVDGQLKNYMMDIVVLLKQIHERGFLQDNTNEVFVPMPEPPAQLQGPPGAPGLPGPGANTPGAPAPNASTQPVQDVVRSIVASARNPAQS